MLKGDTELDTSQGGFIRTGAISPDTSLRISLPYSLEHNLNEISTKVEAQYTTSSGSFNFTATNTISIALPLDVDVNDIFKASTLFSRFSIRTTTSIPLQITNVKLQDSPSYAVCALPCPLSMTVFEKQPASLTYRITKKSLGTESQISKKDASLAMTVHYLCVDEIILNTITSSLQRALDDSPYAHLKRLLIPLLRSGAQSHALALQFERAVLFQELTLPFYDTIGWDSAIATLPLASRDGLVSWLQAWHKVSFSCDR